MKKPETWAVAPPDEDIDFHWDTCAPTRESAIREFVRRQHQHPNRWPEWEARGYRAVKLRVEIQP